MSSSNWLTGYLAKKGIQHTHTHKHSVGKIVLLISGISHRSKGPIKKWRWRQRASFASQHALVVWEGGGRVNGQRDASVCTVTTGYTQGNGEEMGSLAEQTWHELRNDVHLLKDSQTDTYTHTVRANETWLLCFVTNADTHTHAVWLSVSVVGLLSPRLN